MRTISATCGECGEKIEAKGGNLFKEWILTEWFDLKLHCHYVTKHQLKYFTTKGVARKTIRLIVNTLFFVIIAPIYVITYPFWWVNEKISR
jgi:hypothetical protein